MPCLPILFPEYPPLLMPLSRRLFGNELQKISIVCHRNPPLALHCYTECIAHLDQITYFEVHCIASWYIAEFMATALSLLNSLHWSVLIAMMYWYNCPIVLERCWAVDAIMHWCWHWLCICVTPALAWYLVTQSHSYALVAGSSSKHNGVFYTLSVYVFKEDTVLSWIITNATCWQTVQIIVKISNLKSGKITQKLLSSFY